MHYIQKTNRGIPHCLVCKGTKTKPLEVRGCAAFRCLACDLEFLYPPPTTDELKDLYSASYYESWGSLRGVEDAVARTKEYTAHRFLSFLEEAKGARGKLLDVGCAFGYFMKAAQERGYDPYGVELSAFSARIAESQFPGKVTRGELSEAPFPDGMFDVVILSDVLEHVLDPLAFMHDVRRVVKEGGRVLISTPNTASLSRVLLGNRHWFHYKPEHLTYFNPTALTLLAKTCGFKVLMRRGAVKWLSPAYLASQLAYFPIPLLTPLMKGITRILPRPLRHLNVPLRGGEMLVVLLAVDKPRS